MNGTSGVNGPAAADGFTSAMFPGSPVRSFSRLLLRNQSGNSWHWYGEGGSLYFSDAYMKETDRALGNLTAQRRWTHCWVNGVYWGLYDFEEFMDADWVSRYLNAAVNPPTSANPDPAQDPSLAASQILFFSPASGVIAPADWTALNTAAAEANPTSGFSPTAREAAWNLVQQKLHLPSYMDFVLLQSVVADKDSFVNYPYRAWRHPVDGKWRLIGWDGDYLQFRYGGMLFGQASDGYLSANINPPVWHHLQLHAHLKEIPAYREAFAARVAARIKASSADPAPPLTQSAILARFDAQAAQVRTVLECEAMRWIEGGSTETATFYPPDGSPSYSLNKGHHRLQMWGVSTTIARTAATSARADIKAEAREGKFLNDIPPPTITFSGGKAYVTRPGNQGRIYFELGLFADPKSSVTNPALLPSNPDVRDTVIASGDVITARIYSYDLDGELVWSASTIAQAP